MIGTMLRPPSERLLVVEDAFVSRGPGVLVLPRFTAANATRGTFPLRLVTPDGRARVVEVTLDVAHVRGSLPPFAMYRLLGVTPEDVPRGSELWSVPEEALEATDPALG
jgi:hypothetical protein